MTRAIVLGGGVAGLSAAFALRDLGLDVRLLESRGWLGGRAFSPPPRADGPSELDNGPHVMLGCYEHMRGLLRRIGSEACFDQPRSLCLDHARLDGTRLQLRLPTWLPAALGLPIALAGLRGVTVGDRLRAMRGMLMVGFGARASESLAEWLARRGQHGVPRSLFWDPLCRAIMNAEAEQVGARGFLATLRRAFLGWSARRAAIWAPRAPWREILDEPARRALAAAGITLQTGWRASGCDVDPLERRVTALHFDRKGRLAIEPDTLLVCAIPWHALHRLSPELAGDAHRLTGSPIVSVYFEASADAARAAGLPDAAIVSLVDGDPFHFYCRAAGAPPGRFALLSGGRRDLDGVPADELEARAREQVVRYFKAAGPALATARAQVVKEARATFLAEPGSELARPRPGQHPRWRNVMLCGDWTATGLPATLEGAAASAILAVRDFTGLAR